MSDQVRHPIEQDGLISGQYLDREYGHEWWTARTPAAWAEFWRNLERAGYLKNGVKP